jgi:hypothetical protein
MSKRRSNGDEESWEGSDDDGPPAGDGPSLRRPKRKVIAGPTSIGSQSYTPREKMTSEKYNEIAAIVKSRRSGVLSYAEKMDVVMVQAGLRFEHDSMQMKLGNTRKLPPVQASEKTAKYLGRGLEVVKQAWAEFAREGDITAASYADRSFERVTRIPRSNAVVSSVMAFVRGRRANNDRTTAKEVLDHMESQGIIKVNRSDKKDYNAAMRAVQRFVAAVGFMRGEKKGHMNLLLKANLVQSRDAYVVKMVQGGHRIVYMDESYIHHHYSGRQDSLYHPDDELDKAPKRKHKGQRCCFIAAIVGPDPSVPEEKRSEREKAHLLKDTLHVFTGGTPKGKKQTKDYHGMFNGEYFVGWMEKLLNALDKEGIKGAYIVMDNAKYHKVKPADTPKFSDKKEALEAACQRNGCGQGPRSGVLSALSLGPTAHRADLGQREGRSWQAVQRTDYLLAGEGPPRCSVRAPDLCYGAGLHRQGQHVPRGARKLHQICRGHGGQVR